MSESEDEGAPVEAAEDSKPYLDLLDEAEKQQETYHSKCDEIAKMYASLSKLGNMTGDREFRIFWANMEVMRPTVYSRPPIPVVGPRFKDRRDLPRKAADLLERALSAEIEIDELHGKLEGARDDLTLYGRGVLWTDYSLRNGQPAAVTRKIYRKDFRHGAARRIDEMPWAAKRAFLTKEEFAERFGDVPPEVQFKKRNEGQSNDEEPKHGDKKAEVWEMWHRGENAVIWVTPGVETVLDRQPPMVQLDEFFPCSIAFGTLEPDTLNPVPDYMQYADQLEEINEMTLRISSLAEALKLRGFYPGGSGDVAEAIEKAWRSTDDRALLIPVTTFQQLGGVSLKDSIVWMPVQEVAETLKNLVMLRQQLISDVYEITGLSDIMRGSTEKDETATAQRLKAQFGNVRVQQKQIAMQVLSRAAIRIKAEIMAENMEMETLLEMSQVDDIPTMQAVQQRAQQMVQQAMMQAQQGDPAMAQQAMQAAQQQAQQTVQNTVTLEAVEALLRNQRLRPFVLDIETDSTIQPDEDAEKQRRSEALTAMGGFLTQALPIVQAAPEAMPMVGEALKFLADGFRLPRRFDSAVDEFVEAVAAKAQQSGGQEQAAQQAMQAEAQAAQAEAQAKIVDAQAKAQSAQIEAAKAREEVAVERQRAAIEAEQSQVETRKTLAEIQKIFAEIQRINAQTVAAQQPKEAPDGNGIRQP